MPANNQINHGFSVIKTILIFTVTALFSLTAQADSYNATGSYMQSGKPTNSGSSVNAVASSGCEAYGGGTVLDSVLQVSPDQWNVKCKFSSGTVLQLFSVMLSYTCPYGGTVTGALCVNPPNCVSPQVRDAITGECKAPADPCKPKENTSAGSGWITRIKGTDTAGLSCDGGCQVSTALDLSESVYYTDGKTITQKFSQSFTGVSCNGEPAKTPTTEANKAPATPPKKTPCADGEGVMTSSTGTVACVAPGAPGSNPPIVTRTKETEVFPDGSTKTTETITTRDPATGVESKDKKITNTPATGGAPGTAGTPGTTITSGSTGTTTAGDPTKTGDSDFCAKNPNLQVCKGGMNEEATQKEVRDKLKEINESLNPKDPADTSELDAKKSEYDAKADELKAVIDSQGTKGQSDEGFMSWAMIPEIPASSCTPFSGQISGKTIELDWCDKINLIRDIAGYAFYVLTAFGLFRIFSNSTGATS